MIRQCVDKTGIPNCAYCASFACDALKAPADAWNRKKVEEKLGKPISELEYHLYVEPFEGIKRLEAIRACLKPEEIVEPAKTVMPKKKVVDFPTNLPFSKEETASFMAVHSLLATIARSSLGLSDTDSLAQQQKLENLRADVLRFLWIFGNYGKVEGQSLIVDAECYLANRGGEKTLAIWAFVQDTVFRVLLDFGLLCERVSLAGFDEKDLTTGTGYLRGKGWIIRMT
jgi:hypothetical protein